VTKQVVYTTIWRWDANSTLLLQRIVFLYCPDLVATQGASNVRDGVDRAHGPRRLSASTEGWRQSVPIAHKQAKVAAAPRRVTHIVLDLGHHRSMSGIEPRDDFIARASSHQNDRPSIFDHSEQRL
jgi:hypothetical protein